MQALRRKDSALWVSPHAELSQIGRRDLVGQPHASLLQGREQVCWGGLTPASCRGTQGADSPFIEML